MKLTDFTTLAEAQAYTETGSKMISSDMMVAFMATFNHVNSVMTATSEAAKALQLALQFGSEFNLINGHPASVKLLLDQLVADNTVTQAFSDYAVAYANPVKTPFASATLVQFNHAKNIYTEKLVENHNGEDIKITFNSEHDCTATTWIKSEFADENFGKVGYIKKGVGLTKISILNKKSSGQLYVRVPLENAAFTVEII